MAHPQIDYGTTRFTISMPLTDFQALEAEAARRGIKWRTLAASVVKDFVKSEKRLTHDELSA